MDNFLPSLWSYDGCGLRESEKIRRGIDFLKEREYNDNKMKKENIKRIRDKMISEKWNEKKAEWEMRDLAYLFNLSLPQIYRIIKKVDNRAKNQ